jgi:hypothetical protein
VRKYVNTALIILAVLGVVCFLPACIKIERESSENTPPPNSVSTGPSGLIINSFQASPESIKPGDTVTLAWDVAGADKVSISPEVGPVNPSGITTVKPQVTTTYTLEAQGGGGAVNKSVIVNVDSSAAKPDIVITDIFIRAPEVYLTAKNAGNAPSAGCRAYLYIDGTKVINGDTYIEPMKPGEEKTEVFGKYPWQNPTGPENLTLPLAKPIQWELKVCGDVENTIDESNENNNCKSIIMGQEFVYSFYEKAHLAHWVTGAGKLVWPVPESDTGGAAFTTEAKVLEDNQAHGRILATYPQQAPSGWISGTFADFYTNDLRQAASRLLVMPKHCKFTADVGFTREAAAGARVKFVFSVLDQGGMPLYVKEIVAEREGSLNSFNEDLSALAGATCTMVLRIESQGTPGGNLAVWSDPLLTQKW